MDTELGSDLTKLVSTLECTHRHFEDGRTTVLLNQKELLVISAFITSILNAMKPFVKQTKFRTSMFESILQNKKTIFKDNQTFYKINTLLIQLLKILVQDLTSNDVDFSSSWNCVVKDSFKQLWLPAKIDFVDSGLILSDGNSSKTMLNSWFLTQQSTSPQKKNLQKTFLPFYKSLLVDGTTVNESTLLRTKKIKLQLTSLQIKQVECWRHASRFSYNKAVWLMNEDSTLSKLDLRNLITPAVANSRNPWILDTPTYVREAAVFEAYKNRQAAFTNLARNNINHFELRYLSKKKESWTMGGFDLRAVKKINAKTISVFPKYNIGHFKTKETVPDNFQTCQIHFDGLHYYILVPVETEIKKIKNKNPCVSSDPGVKTFHTLYDGYDERCYKVGTGASEIIYKELIGLDKLIMKQSKNKNKHSKKLITKQILKKRKRIQDLQAELHWKTSHWVCNKYDRIVIPQFNSKKNV